jgi:hypothetical protein
MAREIEKAGRRFFLGMMLVVFASKIGAAQTLDPRPLVSSSSADHQATDSIGQLRLAGSLIGFRPSFRVWDPVPKDHRTVSVRISNDEIVITKQKSLGRPGVGAETAL